MNDELQELRSQVAVLQEVIEWLVQSLLHFPGLPLLPLPADVDPNSGRLRALAGKES